MQTALRIETLTPEDLDELRNLQPEHWGDIIPANQFYIESDFCYAVKAVLDQKIVGCGTAIVHNNVVWIANIIVHADYRNRGIGHAITSHVLDYSKNLSPSIILIATKLGRPVYVKLGFNDDEEYVFFKKRKIDLAVPPEIIPYEERFKEAIMQLDYDTTGEKRPDLLLPRLHEAYVYVEDGDFKGFSIPSLGEGLTLATSEKAGLALMICNLQEEKRAAIPVNNKPAIDFLRQNGFETDPDLYAIKMYLGKRIPWKSSQTYGRVGGNMG